MFALCHTYGMCRTGDCRDRRLLMSRRVGCWLVSAVPLGAVGRLGNEAFASIVNSIEPDSRPAECLVSFFFLSGALCSPAKTET